MMNFGLFMQQQQRQLAEVAQRVQQQQREAEEKRLQMPGVLSSRHAFSMKGCSKT